MTTESANPPSGSPSLLRNWTSLTGIVLMVASGFAFLLLFFLDAVSTNSNPYVGILAYMVAPAFFFGGLMLVIIGAWFRRRRLGRKHLTGSLHIDIDLGRKRDRRILTFFIPATAGFLLLTAMGSYHSYEFTESVTFCGQTCHTVMQPEFVTYSHSSHARVACAECHVGKGAEWYVRSKLSGTYQLYSVMAHKYATPIATPIKNLRPAQDTCEQCHWPAKFVGDVDKTFNYFIPDKTNTLFSVRMLLKVGGGDPTHGPVGGIHWHMNVANKIEYLASDETRQKIPWIRMTDKKGVVTEYRTAKFTNAVDTASVRRMDCMDCHNRPAHKFNSPESTVNLAMLIGDIDTGLPWIKTNAEAVLCKTYTNEDEAMQKISTTLSERYPGDVRINPAIAAVQKIYTNNFFPEMKSSWKAYPDNIGHKDWPGCFRCHDGNHVSIAADGKKKVISNDCNACHTILSQGNVEQMKLASPLGQKFNHPQDEYDPAFQCTDCHNGGL